MSKHSEAYQFLLPYLTEARRESLNTVLSQRTRHLTVLLEDVYSSQNASAILRSCDCFGIQDVHLAEQRQPYKLHTNITRGAEKWLSIRNHGAESTVRAIASLKADGYRVMATSPHEQASSIDDIDMGAEKIALVFGNERDGISPDAEAHADGLVYVPMVGFSESLNVSVTVALCLYSLRNKLLSSGKDWRLSNEEYEQLQFDWARKSVKSADDLLRLKYGKYAELADDMAEFPVVFCDTSTY